MFILSLYWYSSFLFLSCQEDDGGGQWDEMNLVSHNSLLLWVYVWQERNTQQPMLLSKPVLRGSLAQ